MAVVEDATTTLEVDQWTDNGSHDCDLSGMDGGLDEDVCGAAAVSAIFEPPESSRRVNQIIC